MNTKCQIFTPENYVEKLLDVVNYRQNLSGKKILENSCGDGNILLSVVRRYIIDCKSQNYDVKKIKDGLKSDIYGIEIDSIHYEKCIDNLNNILKEFCIEPIDWNIKLADYLNWNNGIKFDYIVGNPPYITYHELPISVRNDLKENFSSCKKGKFDYCYAFIEKSLSELADGGKMSYLIPSSIFKTVFGERLREIMALHIEAVIDYTNQKVFDNALVKSAIMISQKNRIGKSFFYTDIAKGFQTSIDIASLGKKWFFCDKSDKDKKRFGDNFQVSHVVATLLNNVFVLKGFERKGDFYIKGNNKIETALVKNTATPKTLHYSINEKIIFPYYYESGKLLRYKENELSSSFPEAYKYLTRHKANLELRRKDASAHWYEYGRSQALGRLHRDKLLMSTVVTDTINVYKLSADCIPYAGIYIVPKNENHTLAEAKMILENPKFMEYAMNVGIHISGNSLRITSKDVMEYRY